MTTSLTRSPASVTPPAAMTRSSAPAPGIRHLVYVLALLEASLTVLAALGQALMMGGSLLYFAAGCAVAALYIVAGVAASRGRRYGIVILIVSESLRLTGFSLSILIGLLPWVELPLTVATLTDGVVLPLALIILAGCALPLRPESAR